MPAIRPLALVVAAFVAGATCTAVARPSAAPAPAAPPPTAVLATVATTVPTPTVVAGLRDGTFVVGTEIAPGTYRAPGGSGCYWERLRGFGGLGDVIANDLPTGPVLVTIAPDDRGFKARGCGVWTAVP